VLQCVAACCSVLQYVTVCCSALQGLAAWFSSGLVIWYAPHATRRLRTSHLSVSHGFVCVSVMRMQADVSVWYVHICAYIGACHCDEFTTLMSVCDKFIYAHIYIYC